MATVVAPPMILGERPDQPSPTPPFLRLHQRRSIGIGARGRAGAPRSLVDLAARIERSESDTFVLDCDALPPECWTRSTLVLLQRRAERRHKRLVLRGASSEIGLLAEHAGIAIQVAASRGPRSEGTLGCPAAPIGVAISRGAPDAFTVTPGDQNQNASASARPPSPSSPSGAVRIQSPLERSGHLFRKAAGVASSAARRQSQAIAHRLPHRVIPVMALGGACGSVLLLLLAMLLPSATVTLLPMPEAWSAEMPVTIDPAIKRPDLATGRLPGRTISQEVVETKQVPTTGRKPAPDARASGEVVFVNRADRPITVPRGTVVLAGALKFTTQAEIAVPGTVFSGPQQRIGMSRVPVLAVHGGSEGNVDRFQINKIEGPLANSLEVHNDAPLRGGNERTVAFVTADDRRKLQESLYTLLTDRLSQQIKSSLPNPQKETLVPWSGQNPAIVEATFNKNVDEEAATLTLTMKLRYGATIFSNDAYNAFMVQLARSRWRNLNPNRDLVAQTLQPQPPSAAGVERNGEVKLTGRVSAAVVPAIDAGALRAQVVNRSLAQAHDQLSAVEGITAYELSTWPGWIGRTPLLGWRIAVRTQLPTGGA